MGMYLNPGNQSFKEIIRGKYVDKTGLIALVNEGIGTPDKLVCVSRPRRFGKSFAAQMLCAYYDRSCDSGMLFHGLNAEQVPSFRRYLNRFDVIYLDISGFISSARNLHMESSTIVGNIRKAVIKELRQYCPEAEPSDSLGATLARVAAKRGEQFFFIIDEWDALFREAKDRSDIQEDYISLLRELFKNGNVTGTAIAGAYMTGILPIKKYGTQSAISDFREFTMIQPDNYAPYVGFTEEEVKALCLQQDRVSFSEIKKWYDGYAFGELHAVYNPNSVMEAVKRGTIGSYWAVSETYETLQSYIEMDFDGLQQYILQLLGGARMPVNTLTFQNDMTSVKSRDDVLSLLIHLGYLAFDRENEEVYIPNEEIRREFVNAVTNGQHTASAAILQNSWQLLADTWDGNEAAVAKAVGDAHDLSSTPLFYNNEQALRSVIKIAYIAAVDDYIKIEELPAGRGYADIVYIPKKHSSKPAMVIELKWNKPVEAAIDQIEKKKYPSALKGFSGDILLVGISYDVKSKEHTCRIRRVIG